MNTFAGLVLELHAFWTTSVGVAKRSDHSVLLVGGVGWVPELVFTLQIYVSSLAGDGTSILRSWSSWLTEYSDWSTPYVLVRIPDGSHKIVIEGLRSFAQFLDLNRDTIIITASIKMLSCHIKVKVKGKVHPCTGTEALCRPYGPWGGVEL